MATTCEPASVVDPTAGPANASPRLLAVPGFDEPDSSETNPPPNPHFVFPARDPDSAPPFPRTTGRRPQSAFEPIGAPGGMPRVEPSRLAKASLPSFSFNPGASSTQDNSYLSPSPSPPSLGTTASSWRSGGHGHRRGGSEYVGGSIRHGDSIMNINPGGPESGFAPTGPPPNRRGRHAHRRSAALSSHDLSIILQPPSTGSATKGGSAPNSPALFNPKDVPPLPNLPILPKPAEPEQRTPDRPVAVDSIPGFKPVERTPGPSTSATRSRVGFSETVEFIPRPLSLISSDTSSTATAKPGHSVSGSISSLVSATTPPAVEKGSPDEVPPARGRDKPESRPSTAGAILERTPSTMDVHSTNPSSPRRRNSNPALAQQNDTADGTPEPSPSKPPKRWSFFGLEPFTSSQHKGSRPATPGSTESASKEDLPNESPPDDITPQVTASPKASTPRKRKSKGKKPSKKVKTWAGSILTRKSKPRSKGGKNSRPSTANLEDLGKRAPGFGEVTQDSEATTPTTPEITIQSADSESGTAVSRVTAPDEDSLYPMIDLDAALGPFNTPLAHNPEWEAAQQAAGNTKRRLHSAQKLRGFSGPGMHYHRRTESAPEMVPFDDARFAMHRFGSNSTMADVFEEDEEDEEDETSSSTSETETESEKDGETLMLSDSRDETTPTPETPAKHLHPINTNNPSAGIIRRRSSACSEASDSQPATPVRPASLVQERDDDHDGAVQFRTSNIFQGNASPASSATPSPRRILAARDLAPVDVSPLQLPSVCHAPVSPYSMSHGSSFPSPRSPMSIDAQRISTAPSSVNEETSFQSLLLGQPGPEVRISVDDTNVPSLTSTNSTMTRESAAASSSQQPPPPAIARPQRPASVSTPFGRRRSSLASLSRLISSSHGEKSKLSMEVPLDDEPENKTKKKPRRLSRLVQFWRGKDLESN